MLLFTNPPPLPINTDLSSISTWISIITGCFSLVLGVVAISQAYHYYKLSKSTSDTTQKVLDSMNGAVIKLEHVNTILTDKFFGIFEKTVGQVTKGALSGTGGAQNIKKDLEKAITDGTDKIEGQIKSVTDSFDKHQGNIKEIKESLQVVANAVQDMFNNVLKNIDDYESQVENEYEYLKRKICERCVVDTKVTLKDIFSITSSKITVLSKLTAIKDLKSNSVINYEGEELYDYTVIFVETHLSIQG
jgi:hypothetical protein